MCLAPDSLDGSHTCGLADEVFAALPWPCVVWRLDGQQAVMVNAAFQREFGTARGRAGPAWFDEHLQPTGSGDEFVLRDAHAPPRRYRMTRQLLDMPPEAFHAVFLVPLPEDDHGDEPAANGFAALRPDVSLTRRESQVLDGIMCGKLNKVIASELCISPKTVELHRANLMAKLRVHNVVELARAVLDLSPRVEDEPIVL
jgi:DNA-binding CsgD family transcriptional regulator